MTCRRHPGAGSLTARLLDVSGLQPGAFILDLGCGEGASVAWLRDRGYRCDGLDLNPGTTVPGLTTGDMRRYYESAVRDGILLECALLQSCDVPAVLRACYCGLKPGGKLLLSDIYLKKGTGFQLAGQLATLEAWIRAVEDAGFVIHHVSREDEAWKNFLMEWLWSGKTLEELAASGTCQPVPVGTVGYFLLVAGKESS